MKTNNYFILGLFLFLLLTLNFTYFLNPSLFFGNGLQISENSNICVSRQVKNEDIYSSGKVVNNDGFIKEKITKFGGVNTNNHYKDLDKNKDYNNASLTSAKAMCVLEQNTKRILYEKNCHEKLAMASTTKIFTALTVLENCENLKQIVKIDDRAIGIEGTSIYLKKGEEMTVEELLYGMLLPSGNDSAMALAYFVGGSIENFCKMMTESAKNAGAINSQFKNPHGLDEIGHYTTAYDLAMVTAKAMLNRDFANIVFTKNKTISGNDEVKVRYLRNKNKLLHSFDGCSGVKTGFTDNAGRCFVSSATRGNMSVVCSVLNCQPMFEDCANLMQKAFEEFEITDLLSAYNNLGVLEVEKGQEKFVKIYSQEKFNYPLTKDELLMINYIYEKPEMVKAPIDKEQIVGIVKIYLGDDLLFKTNILTKDSVDKNSVLQHFKNLLKKW